MRAQRVTWADELQTAIRRVVVTNAVRRVHFARDRACVQAAFLTNVGLERRPFRNIRIVRRVERYGRIEEVSPGLRFGDRIQDQPVLVGRLIGRGIDVNTHLPAEGIETFEHTAGEPFFFVRRQRVAGPILRESQLAFVNFAAIFSVDDGLTGFQCATDEDLQSFLSAARVEQVVQVRALLQFSIHVGDRIARQISRRLLK